MNSLIISGPTASGKSRLALDFAASKDVVIINADSLQLYEGLPILSAQPSDDEKKIAPHFLYSHFKPYENSSVMDWLNLVEPILASARAEKKIPVIVGGSGMYISKLVEGISQMPAISLAAKNEAREIFEKIGLEEFRKKFGEEKLIDKQRLIRAAEVLIETKKSIFFWQKEAKKTPILKNFLHVNLNPNREELYQNCNRRFEKMLNEGALEEVKNLNAQNDWPIARTLGYQEIKGFLSGEISREKMIEIATQKTRNYAKRQLTWFRNQLPQKHVFSDAGSALKFLTASFEKGGGLLSQCESKTEDFSQKNSEPVSPKSSGAYAPPPFSKEAT